MLLYPRRTLVQALIVSVLIHVVLVLRVVDRVPLQMDSSSISTINAVMIPAKHVSATPVSTKDTKQQVEHLQRTLPKAKTEPLRPMAVPVHSPNKPVSQSAYAEVHEVGVPASSVVTAKEVSAVPASARDGVSVDDLRQYRMALGIAAKRFKHYPSLARERGWEGVVELELSGNSLSPVPEVMLVRSSGRGVLDEQASELAGQALRVTTLPEGLRGKNFRVPFPVKYSLDDSQ